MAASNNVDGDATPRFCITPACGICGQDGRPRSVPRYPVCLGPKLGVSLNRLGIPSQILWHVLRI